MFRLKDLKYIVKNENVRINSMDLLRGFAILLMYWDHWLWVNDKGLMEGRLITRLAEPLFALLLGYFLVGRTQESLKRRFLHLVIAALISNFFFYQMVGHFDILASFIVVYILKILGLPLYWLGLIGILVNGFLPQDIFDYGVGMVLWQVALGSQIREKKGLAILLGTGFGACIFQNLGDALAMIFTLPAIALIKMGEHWKDVCVPMVCEMGKKPLVSYVSQFPVLWIIRQFLQ